MQLDTNEKCSIESDSIKIKMLHVKCAKEIKLSCLLMTSSMRNVELEWGIKNRQFFGVNFCLKTKVPIPV